MKQKFIAIFGIVMIAVIGIIFVVTGNEQEQTSVPKSSSELVQSAPKQDVGDTLKVESKTKQQVEVPKQKESQKKVEIQKSFGKNTLLISSDNTLTLIDENGEEKIIRENVWRVVPSLDGSVFTTEALVKDSTSGLYSQDGDLIAEIPGYSAYARPSTHGKYVAYIDLIDNVGYRDDWFTGLMLYEIDTGVITKLADCIDGCNIVGIDEQGNTYYNDTQEETVSTNPKLAMYKVGPLVSKEKISGSVDIRYSFYRALHTQDFSKIYLNIPEKSQLHTFTHNDGMDPKMEIEDGVSSIQWEVPNEILKVEHTDDAGVKTIEYRNIR